MSLDEFFSQEQETSDDNLDVLVSTKLCWESIERNPIYGSFRRSPRDTRRLNRWIDG